MNHSYIPCSLTHMRLLVIIVVVVVVVVIVVVVQCLTELLEPG